MYAETSLMFPYLQSFHQQVHQLQDFSSLLKHNAPLASAVSDYDLGAEGDLFKAPEPIIEEPEIGIDPMTAALTMISCGGEVLVTQELKEPDIGSPIDNGQLLSEVFYECKKDILAKEATEAPLSEVLDVKFPLTTLDEKFISEDNMISPPIDNGQLLSEVFYECKKDILAKEATEAPLSEVLDVKFPLTTLDEKLISEDNMISQGQFQKSVSSGCLSTMHCVSGTSANPNFLDFQNIDMGTEFGMRRAFSEGDIKTLGNGNINIVPSGVTQHIITSCTPEDRKEKLLRYKNKRTTRNFGRKIKYACRKALADSQPRIRGRFAKTE